MKPTKKRTDAKIRKGPSKPRAFFELSEHNASSDHSISRDPSIESQRNFSSEMPASQQSDSATWFRNACNSQPDQPLLGDCEEALFQTTPLINELFSDGETVSERCEFQYDGESQSCDPAFLPDPTPEDSREYAKGLARMEKKFGAPSRQDKGQQAARKVERSRPSSSETFIGSEKKKSSSVNAKRSALMRRASTPTREKALRPLRDEQESNKLYKQRTKKTSGQTPARRSKEGRSLATTAASSKRPMADLSRKSSIDSAVRDASKKTSRPTAKAVACVVRQSKTG